MKQQHTEQPSLELSSQLVTIMTTEHYNLRMALMMNMSEISGRSSLFVGAVSSALIAMAFVGQISHLGVAFFVFGLVVLAAQVVMGLITFERVLDSSNTQFMYARGINRIRHLYLEYAPQMPTRCATRSTCAQAFDFWNQNGKIECILLCRHSRLKDE
jgi:hypothetical protein